MLPVVSRQNTTSTCGRASFFSSAVATADTPNRAAADRTARAKNVRMGSPSGNSGTESSVDVDETGAGGDCNGRTTIPFSHAPAVHASLARTAGAWLNGPQQPPEDVVLRVTVPEVLAEALRERHAAPLAAGRAPRSHRPHELVNAVVLHQPLALARV